MNANAFYFESSMAQESTEIARGLHRRDPDLLDRLIEQYQHRLLRYLVYLTGRLELAEDRFQENENAAETIRGLRAIPIAAEPWNCSAIENTCGWSRSLVQP